MGGACAGHGGQQALRTQVPTLRLSTELARVRGVVG